jgi:hypothetical protein
MADAAHGGKCRFAVFDIRLGARNTHRWEHHRGGDYKETAKLGHEQQTPEGSRPASYDPSYETEGVVQTVISWM